jgi:general secretion pathway protein N
LGSGSDKSSQSGVIRIIISNLSSPISPIKPLGAYEISANIGGDEGLSWNLSTTSGPLLLRGQGDIKSGLHFDGEASASPEAQDSLIGLLALLGKREGAVYRLKF